MEPHDTDRPTPRQTTAGAAALPPTAADVARAAGVSGATFSRFMTDGGYVSAAARERIAAAIRDLGYVPDRRAASLTTKRAGLLGFLVSDLRNPFTAALATEVQLRVGEHGYALVLSNTMADPGVAANALTTLRAHAVDGLLLTPPVDGQLTSDLAATIRTGTPAVGIGVQLDPLIMDVVTVDTYAGAHKLMAHLIALGHTRIAFAGDPHVSARYRAYLDALTDIGVDPHPSWLLTPASRFEILVAQLAEFTRHPEGPTAVMALNDEIAATVVQAAARVGLRVPADLSVTGFDDVPLASSLTPPLTTVRQPIADLARTAVDALVRRMEGDDSPPTRSILALELVLRDSCASPGSRPWTEGVPT